MTRSKANKIIEKSLRICNFTIMSSIKTSITICMIVALVCIGLNTHCQAVRFQSNNIFHSDYFVENKGQFKAQPGFPQIDFHLQHKNDLLFITPSNVSFILQEPLISDKESKNKVKPLIQKTNKINLNWLNVLSVNKALGNSKSMHYFSYGKPKFNSYGFKEVVYKNAYPNIDIHYDYSDTKGLAYSIYLKPGSDIKNVAFQYVSDAPMEITVKRKEITINTSIGGLNETGLKAFYLETGEEVSISYKLSKGNIISFKSSDKLDKTKTLVIDPWISSTNSLTGYFGTDYAYDVDYDHAGNLYVIGGGGGHINGFLGTIPKVAKYDQNGSLLWTFNGNLSALWNSSPTASLTASLLGTVGNFTINRSNENIYIGQGLNKNSSNFSASGAMAIRLNQAGNFDQYRTNNWYMFEEIWDMKYNCQTGKLILLGGGTSSSLNLGIADTNSSLYAPVSHSNLTGMSGGCCVDVVCGDLDDNNELYMIWATALQSSTNNNRIFKVSNTYDSIYWSTPSGFSTLKEADNKPYIFSHFSNGHNCLSVNKNYLFYYDGFNLSAYDKLTGNTVGSNDSITNLLPRYQGGIFANDCNEIYVGGDSGNVFKFYFDGNSFSIVDTLLIPSNSNHRVLDIKHNPVNNLLYVCGEKFVATIDPLSSCPFISPQGNLQLTVATYCLDSMLVSFSNADTSATHIATIIDSNSSTILYTDTLSAGINSFGLSGLIWGNTIQTIVSTTTDCGQVQNDTSFTFNCNAILDTIQSCWGDSIILSNNTIINTPGLYSDTVLNQNNQDSTIYFWFIQQPVYGITDVVSICQGQSYALPSNTIVNTSGTYVDTLQSSYGCDSIITTILTVNTNITINDTLTACFGDTITFPDSLTIQGVTTNLIHTSTIPTSQGCDSIINTSLFVLPIYAFNDTLLSCQGDTVTFYDNTTIYGVTTNISHLSILNSVNGCDSSITTYLIVNPTHSVNVFDTICQGNTYTFNGSTYTQAGNYVANLTDVNGCDSTVNLNLYVNPINTNLTQIHDTLFATSNASSYQWYYCETSALTLIPGATNSYYIFTWNGDYAVVINKNGCIDTSNCFSVQSLGIAINEETNSSFLVYPNPTKASVTLEVVNSNKQFESFAIHNILGQVVRTGNLINNKAEVDLGALSKGVYTVMINNSTLYSKIILER